MAPCGKEGGPSFHLILSAENNSMSVDSLCGVAGCSLRVAADKARVPITISMAAQRRIRMEFLLAKKCLSPLQGRGTGTRVLCGSGDSLEMGHRLCLCLWSNAGMRY